MKSTVAGFILLIILAVIIGLEWESLLEQGRRFGFFQLDRGNLEEFEECIPLGAEAGTKEGGRTDSGVNVLICVIDNEGNSVFQGSLIIEFEPESGGTSARKTVDLDSFSEHNIVPLGLYPGDPPQNILIYAQDIVGRRSEPWAFSTSEYWEAAKESSDTYGLDHTFVFPN